jgi:hypothetical protein
MRAVFFILAAGCSFLGSCSIPDKHEPKITMAPGTNTEVIVPLVEIPLSTPGVGVENSPFREYDEKLTSAVRKRWLELQPRVQLRSRGQVVVQFKLAYDGRVSDLQVAPTRLLGLSVEICKQAVLDCAPFDPWPADMRRVFVAGYRDVHIRFRYDWPSKSQQ